MYTTKEISCGESNFRIDSDIMNDDRKKKKTMKKYVTTDTIENVKKTTHIIVKSMYNSSLR